MSLFWQMAIIFCCQVTAVFIKHLLDIRLRTKYKNWYVSWEEFERIKKILKQ